MLQFITSNYHNNSNAGSFYITVISCPPGRGEKLLFCLTFTFCYCNETNLPSTINLKNHLVCYKHLYIQICIVTQLKHVWNSIRFTWMYLCKVKVFIVLCAFTLFLITCHIFFDLMNLADGVVASKHVEVEGLGVFADACPCAYVRRGPSW